MADNIWRPHGLIKDKHLEAQYLAARVTYDPDTIVHDPKEHLTLDLWSHLFQNYIFIVRDYYYYYCSSPVPSDSMNGTGCDLAIRWYSPEEAWHIPCFAGAKRASKQKLPPVSALERQAFDYCKNFLAAGPDLAVVYVYTLIGTRIRCWKCVRGDTNLTGFWGQGPTLPRTYEAYLDAGRDDHRAKIEVAFNHMRKFSPL